MNKIEEIKNMLATEFQIKNEDDITTCPLPYIVILEPYEKGIYADNNNATQLNNIIHYQLEFYSTRRNKTKENIIKTILNSFKVSFEITFQEYISSEKMFETVFEFEILEKN